MNARQAVATVLLSVLLLGQVLSAEGKVGSAPGSVIRNQAEISYIDGATGDTITSYSNMAELVVAELYRFSLVDNQAAREQRNATAHLVHQIHNIGNVADSYLLSLSSMVGTFELSSIAVHEDINGNGIADASEPAIDRTPMVQPGGFVQLIVTAGIPESVADASVAQLQLTAESAYAELESQSVVDTVTVVSSVDIQLEMSTLPECTTAVFPGERISYNVSYANQGDVLPALGEYLVDGISRNGVLLSSSIPANTTFDKTELPRYSAPTGLVLVRLAGDHSWSSFVEWDGESVVESIGLLLPDSSFSPQLQGFFQYSVRSSDPITAETKIENLAIIDIDKDGSAEHVSNTVCNTFAVAAGATLAQLRFVEPAVALRQQVQAPRFDRNSDFVDAPYYRIERGARVLVAAGRCLSGVALVKPESIRCCA